MDIKILKQLNSKAYGVPVEFLQPQTRRKLLGVDRASCDQNTFHEKGAQADLLIHNKPFKRANIHKPNNVISKLMCKY